ncbi:Type I restriction modification DNA specificity domain protein [Streptococcus sanguinis]|jgi:hypothetical protein|uniref:restriction endonuclease subunit S n=1 Tax=Streptococcus sanguinis TaxID=1305 RepID=UPI000F6692DB|nr:restriction endonuclease subunit S [Streptococcus sanguinis]RSI03780.1 Type I restriction modification DNA specificity domain protein [Streptococcus sanguinis]
MVKIKLGDVIDFKNGKSIKKSDGVIPIYGGNGILGYTNKSNFSHTIVVGRVGAYCGSIHVEENLCWVSDNAIAGVPKEGQDLTYLYYVLKSLNLNSKQIGSSQPLITQSMLKDMIVDIEIDIEKQKIIANSISIIDQKIQINNQINQELEAMAKTLYDYWFVQFDFPDQNGKPYKSSGGKMVYHPELKREIPEGWGVEKLGDITICHDSKRVPLSSNDRELVKGEIPYYGATGIMDYVNNYIFEGDYVLMAEDGSVMTEKGTPILQRISGKNWVNNHAHVLEPIKNHSCKLLMMLLKDVSVMKIKTGSIQMKINQENMNKIVVPAIPLELLFEINQKLEVIDKQQLNLIEENKQLTQLRDWLLPMLMNGQVKVE